MKIELSDAELMGLVAEQEAQEILTTSKNVIEEVVAYKNKGGLVGDQLPWQETINDIALGPGELSLWAGINSHGKTTVLNDVMRHMINRNRKVLIASMEMNYRQILCTLGQQAIGCDPSDSALKQYLSAIEGQIYVYDRQDRVPTHCIIGLVYYASALNIDHIVVDSLTMCGVSRDEYEAQAEFVNHLRAAAKKHHLHIHLVCHMRKGESEKRKPNKFDIRGAGEISDLADKVFIVWRNKARELMLRNHEIYGSSINQDLLRQHPVQLRTEKNRQDGVEGVYGLSFDTRSKRYETPQKNLIAFANS